MTTEEWCFGPVGDVYVSDNTNPQQLINTDLFGVGFKANRWWSLVMGFLITNVVEPLYVVCVCSHANQKFYPLPEYHNILVLFQCPDRT